MRACGRAGWRRWRRRAAAAAGANLQMDDKMSSVEGQRVIQVLDDTLNAGRLLSCVNQNLAPHRDSVQDRCGPEVTELLFNHLGLMAEYEDQLQACGGNSKDKQMIDKQMIDMTLRLQDSVRTISRLPRKYPGIVDHLIGLAVQLDMPRVITRCVQTLEGLKQLTRQRLMTTVEEDSSRWVPPRLAGICRSGACTAGA